MFYSAHTRTHARARTHAHTHTYIYIYIYIYIVCVCDINAGPLDWDECFQVGSSISATVLDWTDFNGEKDNKNEYRATG